jgi:hypothetical protein
MIDKHERKDNVRVGLKAAGINTLVAIVGEVVGSNLLLAAGIGALAADTCYTLYQAYQFYRL